MPNDMAHDFGEVKQSIEGLNTAFEEFKKANDARLKEIEQKGGADPLLDEKLEKINKAIDEHQQKLDAFEIAQKRAKVTYVDSDGKEVDLDAKALDWAKRAAKDRNEVIEEYDAKALAEYKAAFERYIRKSKDPMGPDEIKALSVGSNPDGGYWVPPEMTNIIGRKVFETSPVRQYAQVYQTTTSPITGPYDDDEASAGWVGETGTRSETDTPQTGEWTIPVNELYANPRATQRLLDDADFDVEQWLANKIADKIARTENAAFVAGNGVNKPRGFTTYPDGTSNREQVEQIVTGVNGGFAAAPNGGDVLIEAVYKLKSAYRTRGVWFMNRTTLGEVRKLKDSNGAYLWAPGIAAGQPSQLMGYPVADFEDMADIATGSLSIAFGDLSEAYVIAERQGIRVLRDPYTAKPYVQFYTTKRVGGGLINGEALKLIKFST